MRKGLDWVPNIKGRQKKKSKAGIIPREKQASLNPAQQAQTGQGGVAFQRLKQEDHTFEASLDGIHCETSINRSITCF